MNDYQVLKDNLKLDVALNWLAEDAKDDFFSDILLFKDLVDPASKYLHKRMHKVFQFEAIPFLSEHVPKANGMLRDALWLPPSHRILYLAALRHFIARLDSKVLPSVYSYRHDGPVEPDKHPFPKCTAPIKFGQVVSCF